jgi:hypothetical protein
MITLTRTHFVGIFCVEYPIHWNITEDNMTIKRDEKGRIVKGSSTLSPSGSRKKGVKTKALEAMEKLGVCPFEFLSEVVSDKKANIKDRIVACKELLDRSYGKAPQHQTVESTVEVKNKISEEVQGVLDRLDEKTK